MLSFGKGHTWEFFYRPKPGVPDIRSGWNDGMFTTVGLKGFSGLMGFRLKGFSGLMG
jgi:hypothetical protein